ncbi:Uncharacterized protein DBV15_10541 [Temnothorax longispinosus]|uniref:Uncharacterized protein n=1 Tax=Temnothorax longispinosus TaxID=300112 RepID=A0A4S2L7Y4_9HYME|nr:Uncharacterized protein DBV15_10541 [Temnothorax longispinosus]
MSDFPARFHFLPRVSNYAPRCIVCNRKRVTIVEPLKESDALGKTRPCDTSDCRLPPSRRFNPFFSPRLGCCRLGGFDTRPSRAVIKPRPDSYLNGQLSLDLDGEKSIGFCEPLALKLPTARPGSRLRQALNYPSATYRSVSLCHLD